MHGVELHKYNHLKSENESLRRLSQVLTTALISERERSQEYKTAANRAKVDAENMIAFASSDAVGAEPSGGTKSSTFSQSREPSSQGPRVFKLKPPAAGRKSVYEELAEKDIPHSLLVHFTAFLKAIGTYAHEYTTEMCWNYWHDYKSSIVWPPNEVNNKTRLIRDWRGRCVKWEEFNPFTIHDANDYDNAGALLLQIENNVDLSMHVASAFFPVCPLQESFRGYLYTWTEESMANFIGQSVVASMRLRLQSSKTPTSELEHTLFKYGSECGSLKKVFKVACNQSLSTRKKTVKEVYFSGLGYNCIVVPRKKSSHEAMDGRKKAEMAEAYQKLIKYRPDGSRDTSFWRTACFSDICASSVSDEIVNLRSVRGVDKLFLNEPSRRAYSSFRKFDVYESEETSCLTIIRLDAVITSIVDTFSTSSTEVQPTSSNDNNFQVVSAIRGPNDAKAISNRGGRIPFDTKNCLKRLLPLATAQFLTSVLNMLKLEMKDDPAQTHTELSLFPHGCEEDRLNNRNRLFTVAFRYPMNRHVYIAASQKFFKNYVFSWIGCIADCYIMHATSFNTSCKSFEDDSNLYIVNDSDEEAQLCNMGRRTEGLSHITNTMSRDPNNSNNLPDLTAEEDDEEVSEDDY